MVRWLDRREPRAWREGGAAAPSPGLCLKGKKRALFPPAKSTSEMQSTVYMCQGPEGVRGACGEHPVCKCAEPAHPQLAYCRHPEHASTSFHFRCSIQVSLPTCHFSAFSFYINFYSCPALLWKDKVWEGPAIKCHEPSRPGSLHGHVHVNAPPSAVRPPRGPDLCLHCLPRVALASGWVTGLRGAPCREGMPGWLLGHSWGRGQQGLCPELQSRPEAGKCDEWH